METSFSDLPEGAYMIDGNLQYASMVKPGMILQLTESSDGDINPERFYTVVELKRGRPIVLREDGRYETLYNFEIEDTQTRVYNVFWGNLARVDRSVFETQRFKHYEFEDDLVYVEKDLSLNSKTSNRQFYISVEGIQGKADVDLLTPLPYKELFPEEAEVDKNMDSGYVQDDGLDFTLGDWVRNSSNNSEEYYFVVSLTPTKETVIVKPIGKYLDSLATVEMNTSTLTYAGNEFNRRKWEEFGNKFDETIMLDGEGYEQVYEKPKKGDFVYLDYQKGYSLFVEKSDEYGNLFGVERKGNRNCYVYGHLNPVAVYRLLPKEGE